MHQLAKRLIIALFALALTHAGAPAFAQPDEPSEADKAQARVLGEEGQQALAKQDYEVAYDRFKRAEALYHAPTLLLGLARSAVGAGKYVQAQEAYNKLIREPLPKNAPDPFVRAQEDAKKEIIGLDQKIAWATITVTGPAKPVVTLDDESIPAAALGGKRPINPGEHVVKASGPGYLEREERFSIVSGAATTVEVALEVDPHAGDLPEPVPGTPSTGDTGDGQRIGGYVTLGVGAAGLLMGVITGGLAVGKHGELDDGCPGGTCPPALQGTLDDFHTLGTVSTVGIVAGGVLAATGLVVVLTAPSEPTTEPAAVTGAALRARLGLASLGFDLSF